MSKNITNKRSGVSTTIGGDTLTDSKETNRQAVDTNPSEEHKKDFEQLTCTIEALLEEAKKVNFHLSLITKVNL